MLLRAAMRPEAVLRLLLIESGTTDPQVLADALAQTLATPPQVMTAGGGRRGAEALRASRFDVVLMDLDSLGDLASPPADAVARLVKLAEGALTLAISDGSSVSANLEVMRAGAHDCLTRPFAASVLAALIAELSRRHGTARMRGLADAPPPDAAVAFEGSRAVRRPVLPMWRQEQRIIEEAIASFSGNISLAAQALELSPSTIYRKRQHWAESNGKRGAA
jgi:two-component system repressor protein LuxO